MTQQEILDYNKRCALLLGWENKGMKNLEMWVSTKRPSGVNTNELLFHSDWNWIMEVVEAIENLGFDVVISKKSCSIWIGGTSYSNSNKSCEAKQEAAVQAIDKFLIWYNENR